MGFSPQQPPETRFGPRETPSTKSAAVACLGERHWLRRRPISSRSSRECLARRRRLLGDAGRRHRQRAHSPRRRRFDAADGGARAREPVRRARPSGHDAGHRGRRLNVVDIHGLSNALKIPVIVVVRKLPDMNAVRRALFSKTRRRARRWLVPRESGSSSKTRARSSRSECRTARKKRMTGLPDAVPQKLWIQRAGLTMDEARRVIVRTTLHGNIPEPASPRAPHRGRDHDRKEPRPRLTVTGDAVSCATAQLAPVK